MKSLIVTILLAMIALPTDAAEKPKLKESNDLTARVVVRFSDLRYGMLATKHEACKKVPIAVVESPRAPIHVFIHDSSLPSDWLRSHYVKVSYKGMTLFEKRGVVKPKNVVKDACQAIGQFAETSACDDCWYIYDQDGKVVAKGKESKEAETSEQ